MTLKDVLDAVHNAATMDEELETLYANKVELEALRSEIISDDDIPTDIKLKCIRVCNAYAEVIDKTLDLADAIKSYEK